MAADMVAGAHGRDIGAAEAGWSTPQPVALGKLSFGSVLDALNPLQYLPVVGSLYRVATGDEGSPALRTAVSLIGGVLTGGPVGLLTSIGGILAEHFLHLEQLARAAVAPDAGAAKAAAGSPAPASTPPPPAAAAAPVAALAAAGTVASQAVSAYARVSQWTPRAITGGGER